jgi:hypothetical protein
VRYGSFLQLILPTTGGQVSIALEPGAVSVELLEPITAILRRRGLASCTDHARAPDRGAQPASSGW